MKTTVVLLWKRIEWNETRLSWAVLLVGLYQKGGILFLLLLIIYTQLFLSHSLCSGFPTHNTLHWGNPNYWTGRKQTWQIKEWIDSLWFKTLINLLHNKLMDRTSKFEGKGGIVQLANRRWSIYLFSQQQTTRLYQLCGIIYPHTVAPSHIYCWYLALPSDHFIEPCPLLCLNSGTSTITI